MLDLGGVDLTYARSLDADPWGTAKRLLHDHAALAPEGWSGRLSGMKWEIADRRGVFGQADRRADWAAASDGSDLRGAAVPAHWAELAGGPDQVVVDERLSRRPGVPGSPPPMER